MQAIPFYEIAITQFKHTLKNMEKWLDKAAGFADQKKFDASTLLGARLAPDQFPFGRQVQIACDQAKFTAARLTGKQPPSHADTETTLDELRARIHTVIAYLDGFKPEDFNGADERKIELFNKQLIRGSDYLRQRQIPNFYFHVTTAYAILRHNGVDLGKGDFLGALSSFDP